MSGEPTSSPERLAALRRAKAAAKMRRRRAAKAAAAEPSTEPKPERAELVRHDTAGRFDGRRALSAKEEGLAVLLAVGVPVVRAGAMAGYCDPGSSASRARRTPAVQARVMELQRTKLQRLAALAIKRIEDIVSGKALASMAVVADVSKYVIQMAGHKPDGESVNEYKDLRSMTRAELQQAARIALAAEVRVIEPTRPGDDAQPIDIIEESAT